VLKSSDGQVIFKEWGVPGVIPMPGDFDGDGKSDITVYGPSTGLWYILQSSTNFTTYTWGGWGNPGDQPLAGDFDGDGKADLAVWRPQSGYFYVLRSIDSVPVVEPLGTVGDTPVPS